MNAAKLAVQQYWDNKPCGSLEAPPGSEYFQAHARIRYEREPDIESFADFKAWKGRRVLDVGVGMGADFVRFRKAGAQAAGVDLSFHSLKLAHRNADDNQVPGVLLNADAECLPFPDQSFDLVYSWGVLHHTPDLEQALREVRRVLKPEGECRIMLYHRHSILALQCYLRFGLASLRPFTPVSDLIGAHLESPGTKAFTFDEARSLFREFSGAEIKPVVTPYDLRLGRRHFAPAWMRRLVPDRLGWFLLIRARK